MPDWVAGAPLGAARWRLACITRRGVGMTLAAALYWLATALLAGPLAAPGRAALLLGGALLVYPLGWSLNRLLGGDLTARGSELRGMVGAVTAGQVLGWPLLVAVARWHPDGLAFALAVLLGVHFLPYGWLYRAPGYVALGITAAAVAALLQVFEPVRANAAIPVAMALLHGVAVAMVLLQNRREGIA